MKKLIAVVTMLLAFTVSANAQDKKMSVEEAAKKDVAALVEKLNINGDLKNDMYTLMIIKYNELAAAKSAADKAKVSEEIEHKILSGLNKEQRKILTSDAALLKQVSH